MPWNLGPSVIHHVGFDYWRTWFFEECDQAELFGVTESHVGLVTLSGVGVVPYRAGTRLFLEDAPYFKATKARHRIVGPYEVFSPAQMPTDASRVFPKDGPVIVFKEAHPEQGPWLDRSSVSRTIEGQRVKFSQTAKRFAFFPFRFCIRRSREWRSKMVEHIENCWLCK